MQIGCILESWSSWRHVCSLPRCRCPWAKSLDGCQGRSLGLWQSLHHEHDWHYAIFCPFSFNIFNSLSFSVVPRYLRYVVTADLCPFARFACWALQRSHQRHWRTWCFQAVWTMCKACSAAFFFRVTLVISILPRYCEVTVWPVSDASCCFYREISRIVCFVLPLWSELVTAIPSRVSLRAQWSDVWRLTCLCFTYCFVWGPCFKLMCEVKYTYVDTFRNTFRCSYIKIVKVRWAGIGYRRVGRLVNSAPQALGTSPLSTLLWWRRWDRNEAQRFCIQTLQMLQIWNEAADLGHNFFLEAHMQSMPKWTAKLMASFASFAMWLRLFLHT